MEFQFSLLESLGLTLSLLFACSIQLHLLQVNQEKRLGMCSRARAHRPYNSSAFQHCIMQLRAVVTCPFSRYPTMSLLDKSAFVRYIIKFSFSRNEKRLLASKRDGIVLTDEINFVRPHLEIVNNGN